jgi:hypothetical protein
VLGGLVLLLALTLAGPLRSWVSGRSDIDRLTAEGRALDARAAELQAELARQADPAFQARAARERLTYVLPGDRLVVVVDGQAAQGDAGTLPSAPDPAGPGGPTWYDRLMGSVAAADGDPAG